LNRAAIQRETLQQIICLSQKKKLPPPPSPASCLYSGSYGNVKRLNISKNNRIALPVYTLIMVMVATLFLSSCRQNSRMETAAKIVAEWKRLIAEADSLFPGQIDFLLFYQPKNRDSKEIAFQMKMYDFQYPVFMDLDNQMGKANRFPSIANFQCFLLDADNKVIRIGNLMINPAIWELYKQQISGVKQASTEVYSNMEQTVLKLRITGTVE